jgi:hypothetical protein
MINNEMGGANSMHVTEGTMHAKFFSKLEGKLGGSQSKGKVVPVLN